MRRNLLIVTMVSVVFGGLLLPGGVAAADDSGSFSKRECRISALEATGTMEAQWCVDVDVAYTLRSNPPVLELDCTVKSIGPAAATLLASCSLKYTENGQPRTLKATPVALSGNAAAGGAVAQPSGPVSIGGNPTCHETDGTFVDGTRVFNVDSVCV